MPDISMCAGTGCPRKDSCYRHVARPTPNWQAYMAVPLKDDGSCEYYWPVDVGTGFPRVKSWDET